MTATGKEGGEGEFNIYIYIFTHIYTCMCCGLCQRNQLRNAETWAANWLRRPRVPLPPPGCPQGDIMTHMGGWIFSLTLYNSRHGTIPTNWQSAMLTCYYYVITN